VKYIIFLICLIVMLTGCKDKTDIDYDDEVIEAEYANASRTSKVVKMSNAFTRKTIELPDGLVYNDYIYYDNKIYFVCKDKLVVYDNDFAIIDLPDMVDIVITNDHYFVYDGSNIIKMTGEFEIIKTFEINTNGDYIDFLTDKFDRVYFFTSDSITMLSAEGNIIFTMNVNGELIGVHQFPDGKILLNIDDKYVYLDVNNHTLGRVIRLPKSLYDYEIIMGHGYEIYLMANDLSVYGYLEREVVPIKVLDFINSGVNIFDIADLKILSPELMFFDTHGNKIVLLTKTAIDNIPHKKPITLTSYGYDKKLLDLIIDFNIFNKVYHINLIDCSIYKFDDIKADIIIGGENLDINELIIQGELTDLNPLMERDAQLSQRHVLDCVRDPFTYNGELYSLASNFGVHAFAGKVDNLGTELLWTTDIFEMFLPKPGSDTRMFSNIKPIELLYLMTTADLYSFLANDYFKSLQFYRLLEISLQIGAERDRKGSYMGDNSGFIDNSTLLYYFEFNQPDDYEKLSEIFRTDDIIIKGIPSFGGETGVLIEPVRSFAISRKSFVTDGAWEFIKTLMKEYQVDGYFSSLVSDFDKQIESSEKDFISDLIKNCYPVKVSANNDIIFEMIEASAIIYYENAKSIQYTTDTITSKILRYLANNNIY